MQVREKNKKLNIANPDGLHVLENDSKKVGATHPVSNSTRDMFCVLNCLLL